jgi:hypothetical protein
VARLKNLANLDLLNRRTTQEGEAVLNIEGRRVRVEVTTRPVDGGEAADLRFEASAQHYDDESAGTTVQLAAISDWLIRAGCAIVALKLGDQGLYLRTTEDAARLKQLGIIPENRVSTWLGRELISPCFRVSVAGTTGSGDATIAGLLAGLQQEAGPVECITLATAVGACNVEAADAVSGIVHRDEVMKRILSGWARNSMRIDLPGWHWLDHHKVWIGPGDLHL